MTIEPALVEEVLDQVRAGQVLLGDGGRGATKQPGSSHVETPCLQLVLKRLWAEEERMGSRVLRLATLKNLSGAASIVRSHVDGVMEGLGPKEHDVAASVFHHLVTPSGTKITHGIGDLAEYAETTPEALQPVLEKLAGAARILRPIAPPPDQPGAMCYEIILDALAPAVLEWRRRHLEQRRSQESTRLWLARALALAAILVALIALTAHALNRRADAEAARMRTKALELVASALGLSSSDPALGVVLAHQAAVEFTVTDEVERALRQNLYGYSAASPFLAGSDELVGLAVDPRAGVIAVADAAGNVSLSFRKAR